MYSQLSVYWNICLCFWSENKQEERKNSLNIIYCITDCDGKMSFSQPSAIINLIYDYCNFLWSILWLAKHISQKEGESERESSLIHEKAFYIFPFSPQVLLMWNNSPVHSWLFAVAIKCHRRHYSGYAQGKLSF